MIAEKFKNHELWVTLDDAKERVRTFDTEVALDDEPRDIVFGQILALADAVLYHKYQLSALYSPALLDQMQSAWTSVVGAIEALERSPSQQHAINQGLDTVRTQLAKWPPAVVVKGGAGGARYSA